METGQQPLPGANKPGIAPAVRPLIIAVIACAITVFLFSPAGVIYKSADVSFLTAPLLFLFIIRLLSQLSAVYLPGFSSYKMGMAVADTLNGLAFSLFFFLFLNNVQLLAKFFLFQHMNGFLADLHTTAGLAVLFIAGITISRLADIIRETDTGKAYFPIVNALGRVMGGLAIWRILAAFSASGGVADKIGLVFFAGILAMALSNAGHYGENSKNPFTTDAAHWLTRQQLLIFCIGAFITAYILFIRPAITSAFSFAAIIEWLIVCFIGWRLFSGIKNGLRMRYAVEVHETDWQKHVQLLNNLQGTEFPYLADIQDTFTKDGSRDSLLIYLTLLLHNNKIASEEIHRILHPLINYEDVKMPWFAFGWEQRRVLKRNEANRRQILTNVMTDLKYITNPASQKIEEHTDE
jgi:hypothetical protein